MKKYRVEYSAVTRDALPAHASDRLAQALRSMPGAAEFEGATAVPETHALTASFTIDVRLGMADAARDGSRLAKEAVKAAGFGAAQLVELTVRLTDDPQPSDGPTSLRGGGDRSFDRAPDGGAR